MLAKVVDALGFVLLVAVTLVLAWASPRGGMKVLLICVAVRSPFGFLIYTIVAEWRSGQTFGKRRYGLFVVQESGAPITLGQSVVRQLSLVFQIFWIDALFALFTERRQRAFESLEDARGERRRPAGVDVIVDRCGGEGGPAALHRTPDDAGATARRAASPSRS